MGGARTALFNWLFARHEQGVFVLRIEDTDRERSRPELTQGILDSLEWLGLDWDEGPHHQADHIEHHQSDARRLVETGHAYRCFCTTEEVEARRRVAEAEQGGFMYDGRCRDIPGSESERRAEEGEPFALRFRMPEGTTGWQDVVHGAMSFANADLEDFVVLRTDGTPTYNFAVVSDDLAMEITHVIRGADHISNTPKQIQVYRALGHEPPTFGHVPLILGPDGKRLSKRHGATAVSEYRDRGLIPKALVNFLALLGWSSGDDREYFEIDELVAAFTLEGINKKAAVFDHEKLAWLNGEHLSKATGEEILDWVASMLVERAIVGREELESQRARWVRAMELVKARARTLNDVVDQARPFFEVDVEPEPDAVAKHWKDPATARERLARLHGRLATLEEWNEEPLEEALRGLAAELEIGAGKLIHPLRVALTGMAVSPGIFEVLAAMGRDLSLRRIDDALEWLASNEPDA